jgi:hypothetical protein
MMLKKKVSLAVAGSLLAMLALTAPAHAAPSAPAAHPAGVTAAAPPAVTMPASGRLPHVAAADLTTHPDTVYWKKFYSYYNYRVLDADLNTIGGDGTRIQLWDDLGPNQLNQVWGFLTTGTTGLYKLYNDYGYNTRVLSADPYATGGNGTQVQLRADFDRTNQYWWLVDTGYGDATSGNEIYKLVNYGNGRVLDADLNAIGGNGTRVQLWDDLGPFQDNQCWEF